MFLEIFKNRSATSRFRENYGHLLTLPQTNFNILSLLLTSNPAKDLYYQILFLNNDHRNKSLNKAMEPNSQVDTNKPAVCKHINLQKLSQSFKISQYSKS